MMSLPPWLSLKRLAIVAGVLNMLVLVVVLVHLQYLPDITTLRAILPQSRPDNGVTLSPGNVAIEFVNPKGKYGNKKAILERNMKTYKEHMSRKISRPKEVPLVDPPEDIASYDRANATIVALVRNSEMSTIGRTIRKFEKSFNKKFNYPYTFINDEPFTQKFKDRMAELTKAPMEFVEIEPELWNRPDWIDTDLADQKMQVFEQNDVAYAKKLSYHNMCRFYLGTFYKMEALRKYKYYWRIEPSVEFYTDIKYDVFKFMQDAKKVYGFTINLFDIELSVETLWPETLKFLNAGDNYKLVNENGAFQWLVDGTQNPKKAEVAGGYLTCHFWSNFEIADMDFYRNSGYDDWFQYLDSTGGFYYERWGDAPVHSIGVGLFADKRDVHFFQDIGYFHDPYVNCPVLDDTSRCTPGQFLRWEHLFDQNCMGNWIDYSMEGVEAY